MEPVVEHTLLHTEAKHVVEVVVHVSEALEARQRTSLIAALGKDDGIVSAEFCPLHYHLMLVKYHRDQYSSQDVLSAVGGQKIQARLIGPI